MISPKLPENEFERQLAVNQYQLLDTLPEESYDNITALMAYICEAPISLVTLLDRDRNFLKSHHGVPFNESPREISFCGHAINSNEVITVIEDSRKDIRFYDNPLVVDHQAIFYAGVPLVNPDGYKLGTLCVYDTKPRTLTDGQKNALIAMAKQVVSIFELRFQNLKLVKLQGQLQKRNEALQKFSRVVSHDLKSPMANIISLTELLESKKKEGLDEESRQYLEYIKASSYALKDYVDGLLKFYDSDELLKNRVETISIPDIIEELKRITNLDHSVDFQLKGDVNSVVTNKSALLQVLVNLVTNSIKYNSKHKTEILIDISENDTEYLLVVHDNGDGIPEAYIDEVFEIFSVGDKEDKYGNMGTGIGLASVKNIIDSLGGEISVSSKLDVGTIFTFSILKQL
ncbi:GAF domain-containing sensor histidine kinase [Tamlana agarivorans]|uniref:GAF domain-containing sensor histidine kinase n=1 Tax=Pseudotamlana agarivorans TaxID=481183 RepID=A0ACC5U541_9FLAO|nr:GAF domain-containing sensor histidine kinase [Tamlana agarivorans]MBU2949431.1 GAF domain-containing sensor histidine kinase [Tamlana agarivorans]